MVVPVKGQGSIQIFHGLIWFIRFRHQTWIIWCLLLSFSHSYMSSDASLESIDVELVSWGGLGRTRLKSTWGFTMSHWATSINQLLPVYPCVITELDILHLELKWTLYISTNCTHCESVLFEFYYSLYHYADMHF